VHGARKAVEEHAAAPEHDKTKVTEAISAVENAAKGEDVEAIKGAVATLMAAMSALLQSAAAGQAQAESGAGAQGNAKPDDVVDAEFEEVDKK
jgi:molecular chaperone DnaK